MSGGPPCSIPRCSEEQRGMARLGAYGEVAQWIRIPNRIVPVWDPKAGRTRTSPVDCPLEFGLGHLRAPLDVAVAGLLVQLIACPSAGPGV